MHVYSSRLEWHGSTAVGYEAYGREHQVVIPPAGAELRLSSDPAFRGDAQRPNPEQLLLAAASSCQLLSFLAIAARARIDVRIYEDDAEALMPEDEKPMRITRILLRPRIVLSADTDLGRVRRLVERAHEECFIANTLAAEVVIEPKLEHATLGLDARLDRWPRGADASRASSSPR